MRSSGPGSVSIRASGSLTQRLRRLPVPYPVALVLAGLLLGSLQLFPTPHLTRALLFSVFLPGLLFEASFHIRLGHFWRNSLTITGLAVPGVLLSAVVVALLLPASVQALGIAPAFGWLPALVFGALISATDPIAVIGLFRNVGAPHRLQLLVEVESLLNDGTSIVFFTLALSLLAGTAVSATGVLLQFLRIVGIAVLIGGAIGLLAAGLLRRFEQPAVWLLVTLVAAYGAFLATETLGASGVIATVTAGMLCGNGVAMRGAAAHCHATAIGFWSTLAFLLNCTVFLLIGLEVHVGRLLEHWLAVLVAFGVVTASRVLVVAVNRAVISTTRERYPWRWTPVLVWGGLRGALPMVLALSLEPTFPQRSLLVTMTFGVAVISILLQGLTMQPLLSLLGLQASD